MKLVLQLCALFLGIFLWSYHEPLIGWIALKVISILKLAAPIFHFAQLLPDLPWMTSLMICLSCLLHLAPSPKLVMQQAKMTLLVSEQLLGGRSRGTGWIGLVDGGFVAGRW